MRLNAWKYFKKKKKTLFNVIIHSKHTKGFLLQTKALKASPIN
ncbi:hypothetical protein N200_02805 [Helicobacter pylori UM065]|nr:hypothetical protein N200_02805 [Helicobacter pylori UM065]